MQLNLNHKYAFLTGVSQGIGQEIAIELCSPEKATE